MLCAVSVDPNLRGRSEFYGLGTQSRYYYENASQLQSKGILRNLSSGIIWESRVCDATLILFNNIYTTVLIAGFPPMVIPAPDYNGTFLQLTNPRESGSEFRLDHFSDYGYDNKAASLIEVRTWSLFRYSFRDLFLEEWKKNIDNALGSDASRQGDPIMTWEMWPQGVSYLDPNARYLKIHQPIRINVPNWPDYDASITYHIYLYLDPNGKMRGYCARWAYWVEGGIKSGQIADRLEPSVKQGCGKLTQALSEKLDQYSDLSFSALYYLPGRQLDYPPPNVFTGHTLDDVTIVLEF
jgi:hypothetical protein